jgi:hypothetical protein
MCIYLRTEVISEPRLYCDLLEYYTTYANNSLPRLWKDMPTSTFAVEVLGYGFTASVVLEG